MLQSKQLRGATCWLVRTACGERSVVVVVVGSQATAAERVAKAAALWKRPDRRSATRIMLLQMTTGR